MYLPLSPVRPAWPNHDFSIYLRSKTHFDIAIVFFGKFCDPYHQTNMLQFTGETVHLCLDLPHATPR